MRAAAMGLLVAALAACAPLPPKNPMATWVRSPNFERRRPVLIVVHFTDEASVDEALHTLRTANSGGPVSAHYLIGSDGHIYQLVRDADRAWHAGPGHWGTITDVNNASIGIELDNNGHVPFAEAQIQSLLRLLTDLTTRLHIPPTQVIGHEDFAPTRKVDPGPLFPWRRLAEAGFGLWPEAELVDPPVGFDPWLALAAIGYPLEDRPAAVRSFHHHFRGMEGEQLDAEDLRILYNLAQKIEGAPAPAQSATTPG
jgi:N-acetylmuramoyl-L-alanine amidase